MDVLTDYLIALDYPDSESECQVRLIEYLGAQRKKHTKKFQAFRKHHLSQLQARTKRISRKMAQIVSGNEGEPAPDSLKARVAASALSMIYDLKEPAHLQKENLHGYRLKVKEVRNLLQMTQSKDDELVKKLGEVKDAIGQWHDWVVLAALADKVLEHGKGCGLVAEIRRVADDKYDSALAMAQNLRGQFLRLPKRSHGKSPKSSAVPLKEPVLVSFAKIAA
jgi:CHAD domain-containing protein